MTFKFGAKWFSTSVTFKLGGNCNWLSTSVTFNFSAKLFSTSNDQYGLQFRWLPILQQLQCYFKFEILNPIALS